MTSEVNLTGTDDTGGLVADADSSLIEDSAYIGTITTSGTYGGGLLGFGVGATINDSYSVGRLAYSGNSTQAYGGLVGAFFLDGSSIHRCYSVMTISGSDGGPNVGGLVGQNQGALVISDSFFDGNLSLAGGGATTDPIEAAPDQSTTLNNDQSTNDLDPNYFKGNNSVAPLDGWDFSSVWTLNSGDYPSFGQQLMPTIPAGLRSISITPRTIDPSWGDSYVNPGSPALDHYIVEYRTLGQSGWTQTTTSSPGVIVSHLQPSTDYQVRVAAENSVGDSPFSDYITMTTTAPVVVHIASCTELQNIENDLEGTYVLDNDINCSDTVNWNGGAGFVPIGEATAFTGTLDGQGYHITGLYIDDTTDNLVGLFAAIADTGAVSNLSISGDMTGVSTSGASVSMGAVTGRLQGGTITGVSSNVNLTATGDYSTIGGLAGITNNSTITQSFAAGSITAPNALNTTVGGLVAQAMMSAAISDSYARVTMHVTGGNGAGGLVGSLADQASIARSYAVTTITAGSGAVGGLAGSVEDHSSIVNSFAALSFNNTGSSTAGNLMGFYSSAGTFTGNYYDNGPMLASFGSGVGCVSNMVNDPSGCTGVNIDGSQTGHFQGAKTEAPLDQWDFNTVWGITGSYPVLRVFGTASDNSGDGGGASGTDTGSHGSTGKTLNSIVSSTETVVDLITAKPGGVLHSTSQAGGDVTSDRAKQGSKTHHTIISATNVAGIVGLFTLLFLLVFFWRRQDVSKSGR